MKYSTLALQAFTDTALFLGVIVLGIAPITQGFNGVGAVVFLLIVGGGVGASVRYLWRFYRAR